MYIEQNEKIENLKKQIRYQEKLIKEYTEFQKILETAIDDFIKNKFKKLLNLFKKYCTPNLKPEAQFEELREFWGNDIVSDRVFNNATKEFQEYQEYSVARCVDECLFLFDRKVSQAEGTLHELQKELNFWETKAED